MAGQFAGEVPTGSNDVSGFGRVDVASTVAALSSKRTLFADDPDDAVMTGERRIYRIDEVDPDAPLVVTLVWTDAPSGLGGLVNRLYLSVQTPDGTYLNGDVSAFPNPVNNVQRVVIPAPAAGAHAIRVFGTSVITTSTRVTSAVGERQDFAIVAANGTSLTRIR
jgi:serine protease AprX